MGPNKFLVYTTNSLAKTHLAPTLCSAVWKPPIPANKSMNVYFFFVIFVNELSTISNIVYNYIDTSNSKSHNFKSPLPFTTKLSLFVWNKGLWSGSNDSS